MSKKIAIMLFGHIRTWDKGCKESFINKFNKHNPDVYVITYDTINEKDQQKLSKEDIEYFLKDINVVKLEITDEKTVFDNTKNYENSTNDEDKYQHRRSLCQYVNLKNCFNMVLESKKEYDFIVKTRFDLMYNFEEDIFSDNKILYTSNQHCTCDFFACGNINNMRKYSSLIDNVNNIHQKYFYPHIEVTPHMLLHYHLLGGYTNSLEIRVIR